MTDGDRRNWADAFNENPVVKFLRSFSEISQGVVAVATIVGFSGGVIFAIVRIADTDPNPSTGSKSAPAEQRSGSPPAAPSCWSSAATPTSCRESHRFELIDHRESPCALADVIRYLGGRPFVDITYAGRPHQLDGKTCTVDLQRDVQGSSKDVLRSTSAPWRKCLEGRTGRVVPCSEPHTGEYVGTGTLDRATLPECVAAVARYVNQSLSTLADDLTVRVLDVATDSPVPERCLVEARGNHLLNDSMRDLGVRPVPLAE